MSARYFRIRLKSGAAALPVMLAVTAALLLVLFFTGKSALMKSRDENAVRKFNVAIAGDFESSPYLRIGYEAMKRYDSSRYTLNLIKMSEAEARAALREGTIDVFVIVPDGFIDAVDSYRNDAPIRYVSTNGAISIGSLLIDELAEDISILVSDTQNAVYGMQTLGYEKELPVDISLSGEQMTEVYGTVILNRSLLFSVEEDKSGQPSLTLTVLSGFTVLFLLLTAVSRAPVFREDRKALSLLLKSRGLPLSLQFLSDSLADLLFALLLFLPVVLLMFAVRGRAALYVPELSGTDILFFIRFFFAFLPAVFMCAGLRQLLYESQEGAAAYISSVFLTVLLLGFLSGCFYPLSFFPDRLQEILRWLPPALAVSLMENLMAGRGTGSLSLLLFAAGCGFYALAFAVRLRKRRADA